MVFLDLPKPFEIFEEVYESLKVGGWLAVYAPYIDQAEIAYRVAKKLNFYNIEILETLERGLEVRPQGSQTKKLVWLAILDTWSLPVIIKKLKSI